MTAEELALLGYPAASAQDPTVSPSVTGGDLSALNPQVGSAPMQAGGAMAAPGIDAATLAALQGAPSPALPPSDPNGLVTGSDTEAIGPDGRRLNFAPNTGADNTYGGAPAPVQDSPSASSQPQQPKLTDWQQYLSERGIGPNSVIDMASHRELLKGFNAMQIKRMEQQDPEKQLKLQQMQHEISTQGMKDQNLQAQTAESQSKVIAGELAKQNAMDAATGQIAELQSQRDNLQAIANHPALPTMVGAYGQFNPGITDQQRNLKSYFDQIDGQKLIDGINKIKNESAAPGSPLNFRITQQEAMAVKDSVNRLKRSQSPEDYRAAISSYSSILDRAIAAKQAQVARMPGVNQDLLKQFSYTPASAASPTAPSSAPASAPVIKTIPGRGTFQSLGNGQWKQIQ
jgi:hypothetical protein